MTNKSAKVVVPVCQSSRKNVNWKVLIYQQIFFSVIMYYSWFLNIYFWLFFYTIFLVTANIFDRTSLKLHENKISCIKGITAESENISLRHCKMQFAICMCIIIEIPRSFIIRLLAIHFWIVIRLCWHMDVHTCIFP